MREFWEVFSVMIAVSSPVLIIVFVVQYFRYRSVAARRVSETAQRRADEDSAELKRQIETLKQRIEVLETIVTDRKYELGAKIANL